MKSVVKGLLFALLLGLIYLPVGGTEPFLSFSHERGFWYSWEIIDRPDGSIAEISHIRVSERNIGF